MKKMLLCAVISMMLILSMAQAAFAAVDAKATIPMGTPVIDGVVDDVWFSAPVNEINHLKDGLDTGTTASWRGLWDENKLYILIEVRDGVHSFSETETSFGDGVEVYFDPLLEKAPGFGNSIATCYFGTVAGNLDAYGYEGPSYLRDILHDAREIIVVEDENSYLYEMAIDLKALAEDVKMAEGTVIGFEIQVNDKAVADERAGAYGWSDDENQSWANPAVLGEVTFGAAAEIPEIAEPETDAPVDTPVTADAGVLAAAAVMACAAAVVLSKRK